MYHGNYENKKRPAKRGRKKVKNCLNALVLSVVLLVTLAVGGTVAYLFAQDTPITNTFKPSFVDTEITEEFDGVVKKNVNARNTGDTDAYIRIKLITYRVNDENQRIGGSAEIPAFTPGNNWVLYNGYYYYTLPVKPGEEPATDLITGITLTGAYDDADGGKQVIEVMAEAIQSAPASAVGEAWQVAISEGSVTAYSA